MVTPLSKGFLTTTTSNEIRSCVQGNVPTGPGNFLGSNDIVEMVVWMTDQGQLRGVERFEGGIGGWNVGRFVEVRALRFTSGSERRELRFARASSVPL